MLALQLLPFVLVAIIAAVAVLNREFNDSLMQRIGLACMCFGACISIVHMINDSKQTGEACTVLINGLAIYGVATVLKFRRMHRPPNEQS